MNEITEFLSPNFGIVIRNIFIGLITAGLYLILRRLFLPAVAPGRTRQRLLISLGYLEKIFWPVFGTAMGMSLILSQPLMGLALCIFLSSIFWKPINNYFLGIIYLVGKTYSVGQRIKYQDRQGTISAFNNLTLEMQLEGGESLDIPYSQFASSAVVRTSPQSGVMSHAITIPVIKPCDLEKEKQRIKAILLGLPWVLPNQKIVFEHISDETDKYLIKAIVHGIEKTHMYKVERKIKSMYLKNSPVAKRN